MVAYLKPGTGNVYELLPKEQRVSNKWVTIITYIVGLINKTTVTSNTCVTDIIIVTIISQGPDCTENNSQLNVYFFNVLPTVTHLKK